MVGARFQFAAALAFCLFGSAADAKGPPQSEERNVTLSPLERDVTALLREWEPLGRARRKKPFFSVQGEQSPLLLERSLLDPETPGCVTVSVLGAPNQSFLLHLSQATLSKARRAWPIPSLAGIAEITRCGARKPLLAGLAVRLHSRRGVLETTVLASEYPPPAAHELLSHRQAGATVSSPQLGSFPEQATLDQRLRHLERKAERDVASSTEKTEMTSGASGAAASIAQLPAGCHRMTLLARGKPAPPPVLRVEDLATGEGFHSSRGSGKGGSIFFCTARATRTRIVAVDAQPHSELLLYRASFDHSDAIPSHWGAQVRARISEALWAHGPPAPLSSQPLRSALGTSGTTRLAYALRPEACYVIAIAPLHGERSRFSLRSRSSKGARRSQSFAVDAGTTLSACAGTDGALGLEIQADGSGMAWILGLWNPAVPRNRSGAN